MIVALWAFVAMSVSTPDGGFNAAAAAIAASAIAAMLTRRVNVVLLIVLSALAGLVLGA